MLYTDLNRDIDVGASAHLVEIGGFKILVDCGMHPKKMGLEALPDLSQILDNSLDFVCITHAHLDHCGALPVLLRRQKTARVLVGEQSRELMLKMLRNSRNVMARQREEHDIKEYPLFENSEVDAISEQITPMAYNRPRVFETSGGEKIKIEFSPAGHIPGACSVMIEHNRKKYLFSGDISFGDTNLLRGAKQFDEKVDVLVCETTRGVRAFPEASDYKTEQARFESALANVVKDGGNALVPAFALGRMQEILLIIAKAKRAGTIPPSTPVFIGGLGVDIAEHLVGLAKNSPYINFTKAALDGTKILRGKIETGVDFAQKGIYVLGSGMMVENTPAYLAASAVMNDSRNAIFLVGYCDPSTPAGRLMNTPSGGDFAFRDLFFVGTLNCKFDKFDLTSHADREELLEYILRKDPRCVVLTHGGAQSREWFFYEVLDRLPNANAVIADPCKPVEL